MTLVLATVNEAAAPPIVRPTDYWSVRAATGYAPNWYSFLSNEINRRVTGDPKLGPTPWTLKRFGTPKHALEIGCLHGNKIAAMQRGGMVQRASGLDYAAEAVEIGRAKHPNVTFMHGDLNAPKLPVETFDYILSMGVLHHIANLEVCAQALYDSLCPAGVLCASEFTGPQRYAYSRKEVRLINEGVAMLPAELRETFDPASLAGKLAHDPSESVRTRDIGAVLKATFDHVESIPFGGNILMRSLGKIFFANFDAANPEHTEGLAKLVKFDGEVTTYEPSHNTYFVAYKR